jgi:hypothetical protein
VRCGTMMANEISELRCRRYLQKLASEVEVGPIFTRAECQLFVQTPFCQHLLTILTHFHFRRGNADAVNFRDCNNSLTKMS